MTGAVVFDPLLSWPVIWALAGLAALLLVLALWQRMTGALLRALAAVAVLTALANPSWQQEDRAPLSDIVVVVVDDSASQRIAERPAQTEAALQGLLSRIARLPATEARVVRVADAEGDGGTLAMARLAEALADVPRARLAGAFLISD
ncbi:MAG: hypothetical protein GXC70_13350, partial [Sphingomonadaceae bacterium]|nr:hypothetical protein [Sphingomonadaceae bacterium]